MVELAYVATAVAETLPKEDVDVWKFTPSRALDHETPAERIRKGDFWSVLALTTPWLTAS